MYNEQDFFSQKNKKNWVSWVEKQIRCEKTRRKQKVKRSFTGVVFFVMMFGIACAEGEPAQATNGVTDEFVKLAIAMIAAFAAGVAVTLGYKKK